MAQDKSPYDFRNPRKTSTKSPLVAKKKIKNCNISEKQGLDDSDELDVSFDSEINEITRSDDSQFDTSLNSSVNSETDQESKRKKKPQPTPSVENSNIDHRDKWNHKLKILSCVILIAVVLISFCHEVFNAEKVSEEPVARPLFEQFAENNLKILRNNFPSQNSKLFWKVVFSPIRRIIREKDPTYPAILLFALPKGPSASLTGSCLAYHLTHHLNVFHGLENNAFIDIDKDLTHKNAASDKKELDDKLINLYSVKKSKGVVVDHFEKLSPMTTLLFHGYCDGDHAPYKNVSMILVLHTDINQDYIQREKSAVDNFLQDLWAKELDGDKIPPLISRIANNVAIVTPEEEQSIKKLCPWL